MAKKPTARPRRARAATQGTPPPVRVRMYRQGLGDCFLITFNPGPDERHMLIDCGTLGNKSTAPDIEAVVDHIAASTKRGNKSTLDVLVATHAHQDHVSGFRSQNDKFRAFNVQNVWMGWTEDPTDDDAKRLGKSANALRAAALNAFRLAPAKSALRDNLAGVLEFEGVQVGAAGQLALGSTIAEALDNLRALPGAKVTYHSPAGPAIQLPDIPGFRFYVLGPPRDESKLASMGEDGSDELYGLAAALGARAGTLADAADPPLTFDARYAWTMDHASRFYRAYLDEKESYRRIDGQWLESAAQVAAALDRFRNNTSLALAIERLADGKVLLFPADAQQGNWLSWHDPHMTWRVKGPTGGERTVHAADLLKRTVFYKAGHHASHNATAKGKGLELMRQGRDLTAFIPVDREVALGKSPAGSWKMPAKALYRELLEACEGRVARADLGWADDAARAARPDIEHELQGLATPQEWDRWRAAQRAATNVTIDPLFVQYVLA